MRYRYLTTYVLVLPPIDQHPPERLFRVTEELDDLGDLAHILSSLDEVEQVLQGGVEEERRVPAPPPLLLLPLLPLLLGPAHTHNIRYGRYRYTKDPDRFRRLETDLDPHPQCGSESRHSKINKMKKFSYFFKKKIIFYNCLGTYVMK